VDERDRSLHEWNLVTGAEQNTQSDLAGWQIHGAFPDGARQRFTGKAVKSRLDMVPKAQRLPEVVSRSFVGAFSPDHHYFVQPLSMGLVGIEDARTGQSLGRVRGFLHGVHSLAFSPDSQRLAAGSDDRQAVKLWDIQGLQELVTLRGEGTVFSETHFSPDGNLLGSMNYKGVLHVWRAPSWAEIEATERTGL
jgi:WD40 repeat protein